jgi:hypothetical protein
MAKLVRPAPGLTYMDANLGRLVEEAPDVCDFKARIRELAPGVLDVYFDSYDEDWIVTQREGEQESFLLRDKDLGRAYQRVQRARNDRPGAETAEQLLRRLDREQEQLQKDNLAPMMDVAGDAAERLIHAFRKDGILDHDNIYGPKPRPGLARRDVRNRGPR